MNGTDGENKRPSVFCVVCSDKQLLYLRGQDFAADWEAQRIRQIFSYPVLHSLRRVVL